MLIRREVAAGRHTFSLLYPTGPGTGEVPLGALDCPELTLLPPSPDGMSAYALLPGKRSTGVWLVAGGAFGPEQVADVPGRCSGGVWLDREGRLLALDRQMPGGGPVKAVVVDLGRGGEVTPCSRSRRRATTGCCWPTPTAGSCWSVRTHPATTGSAGACSAAASRCGSPSVCAPRTRR